VRRAPKFTVVYRRLGDSQSQYEHLGEMKSPVLEGSSWSACTQNVCSFRDERLFSFIGYLTTVSEYYSDYIEWDGRINNELERIWKEAVVA
jgi:hypothetical protein